MPTLSDPSLRLGLVHLFPAAVYGAGRRFRPVVESELEALRQSLPLRKALSTPVRQSLLPRFLVQRLRLEPPVRKHQRRSRQAEEGPVQADSYQLLRSFWGA